MTRLAIIGTGYVGLTTGACFAHLGHDVVCADIDPEKVERLNRGEITIVEHRLDELVADGLRRGNLRFVVGGENAVADCEIAFLCVPTPQGDDGSADLSYVQAACTTSAKPATFARNAGRFSGQASTQTMRALGLRLRQAAAKQPMCAPTSTTISSGIGRWATA